MGAAWRTCSARPDHGMAGCGGRGEDAAHPAGEELARLPLDLLQRGRYQPRRDMRPESLAELADSIRAQGVVQPIVVRPVDSLGEGGPQRYEIIAGERRWRAAQMAGLSEIPAVIRQFPTRPRSPSRSSRTSSART